MFSYHKRYPICLEQVFLIYELHNDTPVLIVSPYFNWKTEKKNFDLGYK